MVFFESKDNLRWLEITKVFGDASTCISKEIGGNKLETLVSNFFTLYAILINL